MVALKGVPLCLGPILRVSSSFCASPVASSKFGTMGLPHRTSGQFLLVSVGLSFFSLRGIRGRPRRPRSLCASCSLVLTLFASLRVFPRIGHRRRGLLGLMLKFWERSRLGNHSPMFESG